jgi:hypothetical protein
MKRETLQTALAYLSEAKAHCENAVRFNRENIHPPRNVSHLHKEANRLQSAIEDIQTELDKPEGWRALVGMCDDNPALKAAAEEVSREGRRIRKEESSDTGRETQEIHSHHYPACGKILSPGLSEIPSRRQ